ncbi:unnamed protein product [Caretta caretta]
MDHHSLVDVWRNHHPDDDVTFTYGQVEEDWRAVLALLPKKGDLRDLRNWRPVSLLSTDYKVVVQAIQLRLGSVLADVVHPNQTYSEKAFDRVDHGYLLGTLWVFGFGPQFIGILQVLYADADFWSGSAGP